MKMEGKLCRIALYFSHGQMCHRFYVDVRNAVRVVDVPGLYSDHEKADTHLNLHVKHDSTRSPDTDVFNLMLDHKDTIDAMLYFHTGSGKQRKVLVLISVIAS